MGNGAGSFTVIITGGTKGIGRKIAEAFLADGATVIAASRSAPLEAKESAKGFFEMRADVREAKDHVRLVDFAKSKTGRLDAYVNCAGISIWKPIEKVDQEFWDLLLRTNLEGAYWGCQAASSALQKGGAIVNLSSLAGKRGSANNSVYCASKFGLNGITQALAKELGPRGIRVNAVCPVYVETETILESLKDPVSPAGGKPVGPYLAEFAKSQAALQRLPLAEEVAKACLWLASPNASAVTGQCINVDCGVLPQ